VLVAGCDAANMDASGREALQRAGRSATLDLGH